MAKFLAHLWQLRRNWIVVVVAAIATVTLAINTLSLRKTHGRFSVPPLHLLAPGPLVHMSPAQASPPYQFVVPSLKNDDTAWLGQNFPDWKANVYVVDDNAAPLKVPVNKGHEAMVYLTFIIDNYTQFPDVAVFLHSLRYQWHNDNPAYDGLPMLKSLKVPYIISEGYVNLRCVWTLGCPAELHPFDPSNRAAHDPARLTEEAYAAAFAELFPGEVSATSIGAACCAQFSVTRKKILERPLTDYMRYRDWLLNTTLPDSISGRILEYSWHQIFGKPAVHCPDAKSCYCNVYGLCNMTCTTDKCGNYWPFPPSSNLPQGWPEIGWEGKPQLIPSVIPS